MEMQCVFFALEYEFLNIICVKSVFQTARPSIQKGNISYKYTFIIFPVQAVPWYTFPKQ
jgi:hypothetical protein